MLPNKWLDKLTFATAILSVFASGCAVSYQQTKSVVKECVLPDDQSGTLSGKWAVKPVPIAFHEGDFDSTEIEDIVTAANTWNDFYSQSLGITLLDYGGDAASPYTSSSAKPSSLCSKGLIQNGEFTGQVVIYKQGAWPYTSLPDAIAITNFCPNQATPLPNFYMAVMEVNYQNFFVEGKKLPDLQSIFLHEFGHLMGLNHSCETSTKTGMPNCSDSELPIAYYDAVMYPIFAFDVYGLGEQKRVLNDNDQGRANCLYQ